MLLQTTNFLNMLLRSAISKVLKLGIVESVAYQSKVSKMLYIDSSESACNLLLKVFLILIQLVTQ